jgi:hypothetical protein
VKVTPIPGRTHNPFDETHWVSCLRENLTSSSDGKGLETRLRSTLNGHEGGNPGYSQGQSYELPRQSFTRQLVFKRFKSLAQLGHLPKYDDESAKAWLYGKLLVALLVEKLVYHATAISPWGYYLEAEPPTQRLA